MTEKPEENENFINCSALRSKTGLSSGGPLYEYERYEERFLTNTKNEKVLLPFGIKRELLGELQPDGSRLIRYNMLDMPHDVAKSNLGKHRLTPPNNLIIDAVRHVFAEASKVAPIRFEPTSDKNTAHLIIAGVDYEETRWGGHQHHINRQKIIAFNNKSFVGTLTPSNITTALHEFGHAAGLTHPRRYVNEQNEEFRCELPRSLDSTTRSVMSYNHVAFPITYAPMDIAALQSLYGKAPQKDTVINLDPSRIINGGLITISAQTGNGNTLHIPKSFDTVFIDLSRKDASKLSTSSQHVAVQLDGSPITEVISHSNFAKLITSLNGGTILSSTAQLTFYEIHGKANIIKDASDVSIITFNPNAAASINTRKQIGLDFNDNNGKSTKIRSVESIIVDGNNKLTFLAESGETYTIKVPQNLELATTNNNSSFSLKPLINIQVRNSGEIGLRK